MWVPIIYCFYPETAGLELEDIDLIFAKGGFTGGVFSSRGRTVTKHQHAMENSIMMKTAPESEFVEEAAP